MTTIEVEENGVKAKIAKITSMDGDCDVSQRKGKVITLFDLKVRMDYEGNSYPAPAPWYSFLTKWVGAASETSDKTTGSITIPEVAHDSEESDYQVRDLIFSHSAPFAEVLYSLKSTDRIRL